MAPLIVYGWTNGIPIIKVETPMTLVRNENTFPFENKIQESFLQLKEFLNIARVLSGDDDRAFIALRFID